MLIIFSNAKAKPIRNTVVPVLPRRDTLRLPHLVYVFFFIISALSAQRSHALETKTFVAYSMKAAGEIVRKALDAGEDFRTKHQAIYDLAGITRPYAVVFDSISNDWILVGERDPQSPALTLDDWIVALRARYIYPQEDPGVTIDPVPTSSNCAKLRETPDCFAWKHQVVRFFGGIGDSAFGETTFKADWLLKRLQFGLENIPNGLLPNYFSLALAEFRNERHQTTSIVNRYWFFPIQNRVNIIANDLVVLDKFKIGVFNETLYAEVDGRAIDQKHDFFYRPSKEFTQAFTDHYDSIAAIYQPIGRLRGLTQLAALAKGVTAVRNAVLNRFWLERYPINHVPAERRLDVLHVEDNSHTFRLSGGAELLALVIRFKSGDASAFRELILKSRPEQNSISWTFTVHTDQGAPVLVTLPNQQAPDTQIDALYAHAAFLLRMHRPTDAIENFSRVIELDSTFAEAYNDRGVAYRSIGELDLARQDYEKAIQYDPQLFAPHLNLGVVFLWKHEWSSASESFRHTITLSPFLSAAHNNLGIALKQMGDLKGATSAYSRAIEISPGDPVPYYNLGLTFMLNGQIEKAISQFRKAVEYDPITHPEIQFHLAVALFEQGFNQQAKELFSDFMDLTNPFIYKNHLNTADSKEGTIISSTENQLTSKLRASAAQYLRLISLQ